jgi:ribonuclease Y
MFMNGIEILIIIGSLGLSFVLIGFVFGNKLKNITPEEANEKAKELILKADKEVELTISDADKFSKSLKESSDANLDILQKQIERDERELTELERYITQNEADFSELEQGYNLEKLELDKNLNELKDLDGQYFGLIERKTRMSVGSAKSQMMTNLDLGFADEEQMLLSKTEENTKESAEKNAIKIIVDVIQKYARESSVEKKYNFFIVPKDHLKGLVVGENGENILYFEEKTEATVVFNDSPNTVIVSHYNLYKQELAFIAMKMLFGKLKIDKNVIDEVLIEAEKHLEVELVKIGRKAAEKLGLKDLSDGFLRLIGRLKFRTSFGQNILSHSFEVAALGKMMAAELGEDQREAELACFFHDIGKAIDQDVNKPHDILSKEILEENGFSEAIVYAAHAHHDAVPPKSPIDFIVKATDAISASRPGARQETLEKYLEKVRKLEEISNTKPGVEKTYVISAGREVRVFVNPEKIADDNCVITAEKIAREIETEVVFPGKIKVNVIRRTDSYATANKKS